MYSAQLNRFHPVLAAWFEMTFGQPTDVQLCAWPAIADGENTLIAAPTGSGKTLAALLPCLDAISRRKQSSDYANGMQAADEGSVQGVYIVYITPLKALNNDIHYNLIRFIEQIDRLSAETGSDWPGIRCAVRTGDTTSSQRSAIFKRPPELLITTPESLFILLTSEKGRQMLKSAEYVIVDEIHDLAADKRGAHLSLSLERLEQWCGRRIQRIGVSATQKPLTRVARFLGGWEEVDENSSLTPTMTTKLTNSGIVKQDIDLFAEEHHAVDVDSVFVHSLGYRPRPVKIVESHMVKTMNVQITMPDQSAPIQSRESVWLPILNRILELMSECRSVLLFVNSRRLCERLCLRINDHTGMEMARAHHGSMSKERRLEVERLLKAGEIRCIIATSSLELGIDVGHVDLVIHMDSPLNAASGIQRIGRAGHAVGDTSRGIIVARQRGTLPEIAVLGKLIEERNIEPIVIPQSPLDVLSQQTISIVGSEDVTTLELYRLIVKSDSYRDFPQSRLQGMLQVLAGFYPFSRPILDWNRNTGLLTKRNNTSIAAMMGAGTIPQSSAYPVHHVDSRVHLGELDEEFVHESRVGDVFQLGTNAWMIRKIDKDRIYVSETANNFSEIPFWRQEGPGRSLGLGLKVGAFTNELANRLGLAYPEEQEHLHTRLLTPIGSREDSGRNSSREAEAESWLMKEYGLDTFAAKELISYISSQYEFSELPTDRRIVIEHYRDIMNQTHVILHNPFGRRINRTWLLAIQRQFEKLLPYRLYGNAKDNGIEFVIPEWDTTWLQTIWHVAPSNLEPLLIEAITGSPLLAISFRHIAETSLLLSRSFKRIPLWQKRLRSEELLREAMPYAEHFPYLEEAMRECLHHYLDVDRLRSVLQAIADGKMEIVVRETEYPSPMASQFLADYVNMRIYEGDGLDETIQMQLMNVSKQLAGRIFGIDAIQNAVSKDILEAEHRRLSDEDQSFSDAGDLVKLLKERGDMGRDELIKLAGTEAIHWIEQLSGQGDIVQVDMSGYGSDICQRWICRDELEVYAEFPHTSSSVAFIVSRFSENRISFTEPELCERYPRLTLGDARRIVDELLKQERIRQAPFAESPDERIWSSSKTAARIVRLSIGEARKRAQPVESIRWCGHVAKHQHVLQGTQLRGSEGLRVVISRLQGLFLPLSHWESVIFPSRIVDYRKEDLDLLCATGEVIWIGSKQSGSKEGNIAFFITANKSLYAPYVDVMKDRETAYPELLKHLRTNGASFLTHLSRESDQTPTETLSELLELVWEGHASNDQFAPLRLQAAKKQKDWARTGSGFGRWYWTGVLAENSIKNGSSAEVNQVNAEEPSTLHWVRQLLDTFGIITKELTAAVTPFDWNDLLPVLKKLEEWGTVTRGIFIQGALTMQFTTPDIAESVRRPLPGNGNEALTLLSAADPANPYGLFIDWPNEHRCTFARKPGCFLVLRGNQWLYWIENNGKRVYRLVSPVDAIAGVDEHHISELKAMFGLILRRQGLTKIVIERWNGIEASESEAGELLRSMGAERDRKTFVLWMSKLG